MKVVPLTEAERRTLRFALTLAIQWEETLVDALGEDKTGVRKCEANIRKFKVLRVKV